MLKVAFKLAPARPRVVFIDEAASALCDGGLHLYAYSNTDHLGLGNFCAK